MVKKTSIALLGTDVFGTYLAGNINSSANNFLQIGTTASEDTLENLKLVAKKFPGYLPADGQKPVDHFKSKQQKIDEADNLHNAQPVDLKSSPEGFYILTAQNNTYQTVAARILVVTAPAATDLLPKGLVLPGTDSVVTGLLGKNFNFPFETNSNGYLIKHNSSSLNWRGDWGFETDENCTTSHGRIFIAGEAKAGKPSQQPLDQLSNQINNSKPGTAEELTRDPFSPPYEDVDLPRNFCSAKSKKLKELTGQLLGRDKIDDKLAADFKQFCGEIAAYVRFRFHPRLKRLYYKTSAVRKLTGIEEK